MIGGEPFQLVDIYGEFRSCSSEFTRSHDLVGEAGLGIREGLEKIFLTGKQIPASARFRFDRPDENLVERVEHFVRVVDAVVALEEFFTFPERDDGDDHHRDSAGDKSCEDLGIQCEFHGCSVERKNLNVSQDDLRRPDRCALRWVHAKG